MDDKRVKREFKRLTGLLEGAEIAPKQREALTPIIENLAWQRIKLDEMRDSLKDAEMVSSWNNGGGQAGTRENPLMKSYVNLYRAYLQGFEKFSLYLPTEIAEENKAATISILDKVVMMKRG